jgi:hypothetical protein
LRFSGILKYAVPLYRDIHILPTRAAQNSPKFGDKKSL